MANPGDISAGPTAIADPDFDRDPIDNIQSIVSTPAVDASVGAYTGVDVTAYIILPKTVDFVPAPRLETQDKTESREDDFRDSKVIPLGTIKSFSYQVFREKQPVRSLGSIYPKTFVRGTRTIAGTMIFSVIMNGVLERIMNSYHGKIESVVRQDFPYALNDQLPPFDLLLKFNNEYGYASHMILNAVEFFTDGMVISVDNLIIEEQIRYQARGFSGLMYDGQGRLIRKSGFSGTDERIYVEAQDRASVFFEKVLGAASTDVNTDEYALHLENIKNQRKPFI